jgi:hypothetical protein
MISLEIFNARGEVREPIQLAAEIPPIIRPTEAIKRSPTANRDEWFGPGDWCFLL